MADFKEKTQTFVLGMLVGLLIAGSFFIFKLDDYFEKLIRYKNITKTFYLNTAKDEAKEESGKTKQEEEIKKNTGTYKREREKRDFNKSDNQTIGIGLSGDTANVTVKQDSLPEEVPIEEKIVIEKDELIASCTAQLVNLNTVSQAEHVSDSLLQKVSGIRDDKNVAKRDIAVELWRSPLHYKGYKMSKNKLVLYGLPSIEELKIFKQDDVIYMKISSTVYRLEQTYDYKPYQHVDDVAIIARLK